MKKNLPKDGLRLGALARVVLSSPQLMDAYTTLLSGLRLGAAADNRKSILITSTQPNEGKTTVASCLAIAASLAGQSVLLIDGDLRRPGLASAAGIVDGAGFAEILDGQVEADEAAHSVHLFENSRPAGPLSVIAAGRKSPAFLPAVDWSKARTALQSFSGQFDIVLVDSPPILETNDALLLAGLVDGVLLVVGTGSTDRNEVRRAKQQLEPTGTPVIGAVLNRFDPKIHGRSTQPYRDPHHDAYR